MKMTYSQYDEMIEKFEKINTPVIYPTYEQLEKFAFNVEKWIPFCCYVLEKMPQPLCSAEKYSRSNLTMFVNKNLILVDDE